MSGGGRAFAIRPEGRALPVGAVVPELLAALGSAGCAVLAAPPGTGKTTLVPLELAAAGTGRVVVAEPRRMAARAAARRMAWLLGERAGETVGFTVRGERRVSAATRVEVVTTGVLLQRLQRDPELAGVGTVVLDECHERHLDADTAMAFLLDVRAALRPELRLVAASATTDTAAWAALLGGAPVVEAAGVLHPVAVEWAPPPRPVRPPHGTRVDPALLQHVAAVVRRALAETDGDVLCFLPGVGEIARVAGLLPGVGADVLQLHGRAPAAVQEAALAPGGRRRVLLATSVAESSLTVPGVRAVVDAGLAREPRTDHARGLGSLATVRVSRAAAEQRAGRAGREAPGTVYRCWPEGEHERLARQPEPEIALADLTGFALQAACWGDPDASGLALLDPPPPGALAAAHGVLRTLGAVGTDGRPTARGRRLARLGLHPRLARALLDAAPHTGETRAAELVALLSEEVPHDYGSDLTTAWHTARRADDPYASRWRTETRRLTSALRAEGGDGGGGGAYAAPPPPAPGGAAPDVHAPSARTTPHTVRPTANDRTTPTTPAHPARPPRRSGDTPAPASTDGTTPSRHGTDATPAHPARPPRQSDDTPPPAGTGSTTPSGYGTDATPAHPARPPRRTDDTPAPASTDGTTPSRHATNATPAHPARPPRRTDDTPPPAGTGSTPGRYSTDATPAAPARPARPPRRTDDTPAPASTDGTTPSRHATNATPAHPAQAAPAGPVGGRPAGAGRGVPASAGLAGGGLSDDEAAGLVVALGFPERVARRRADGGYLMVSGTGAEVAGAVGQAEWVAVAVADRGAGRAVARGRLVAVVDEAVAREAAAGAYAAYEEVRWADGDVVARRVERLGAVELAAAPLRRPDAGAVRAALRDGLAAEGLGLLRWGREGRGLRERMAFLHRVLGEPWPDVADGALLERAEEWLGPELAAARRRADLERIDAAAALPRLLPWASGAAARFDELAPERVEVPSGSRIRLDYGGEQPVLAVKLQELFGLADTPRVAGVPVLVHLLSPAGRPAAVTADLASFWRDGYRAVRAELRGRYPRHPWPEDPATAAPTRRTNARRG